MFLIIYRAYIIINLGFNLIILINIESLSNKTIQILFYLYKLLIHLRFKFTNMLVESNQLINILFCPLELIVQFKQTIEEKLFVHLSIT